MFTGPVGPVEVFFYWPETVFGNFYWPGAIGLPLASSPGVFGATGTTGLSYSQFTLEYVVWSCTPRDDNF